MVFFGYTVPCVIQELLPRISEINLSEHTPLCKSAKQHTMYVKLKNEFIKAQVPLPLQNVIYIRYILKKLENLE